LKTSGANHRVLRKYNGIHAMQFYWFRKECEFRLNAGIT